jgi:hypothetical protein
MKRIIWIGCWVFAFATISSAQTTFYYPHIVNGVLGSALWKTTIFLTNPAASGSASGTITFTQDNATIGGAGSSWNIPFTDESQVTTIGTITFSIAAGQTKKYVSGGGAYAGGFATVSTTSGTVAGTSIFSEFNADGTRLIAEAGVPQASALPKQALFMDTQGGYHVGVAYANPGAGSATVTLTLLDSAAVSVATTTHVVGPGNHVAKLDLELFPGLGPLAGTLQISSAAAPVPAIALRFDPGLSIFTTLPPVSIASALYPALAWLEEHALRTPLSSVVRLLETFQVRV